MQTLLRYQGAANTILAALQVSRWGPQDVVFYSLMALGPLLLLPQTELKLGLAGLALLGVLVEGSITVSGLT